LAINAYFLFNPLNLTLPRKFKIALSNCPRDCAQGPINDIGLYAHVHADGTRGFAVHVAGGLGAQPFLAKPMLDFVPGAVGRGVCEAIVRRQHRRGERKNRSRARMKYLMKKLGAPKFRELLDAEIARVDATRGALLRRELHAAVEAYRLPPPRQAAA